MCATGFQNRSQASSHFSTEGIKVACELAFLYVPFLVLSFLFSFVFDPNSSVLMQCEEWYLKIHHYSRSYLCVSVWVGWFFLFVCWGGFLCVCFLNKATHRAVR